MTNVLEGVVTREYERLAQTVDGFCGCDACRDDVLVFALNRLPPHYVTQPAGEVITALVMESDQERARVSVILLEALHRVKSEPRPDHEAPAGS